MTTNTAAFVANAEIARVNASPMGDVDQADMYLVVQAYRDLDTAALRTQARGHIAAARSLAFKHEDRMAGFRDASVMNSIEEAITSKASVTDPTQAYVEKVASLQLALNLLAMNVPAGVATDWSDQVTAKIEQAETDESNENPIIAAAQKLAAIKTPGTKSVHYTGAARDVKAHIESAMATVEIGEFLKVSEIRAIASDEYGDDRPSSGAIQASLKSGKFRSNYKAATDSLGKFGAERIA